MPDVSKQIAKRMRELHDGIELLPRERQAGSFVWRNWDKWVERCENIVSYIDQQVSSQDCSSGLAAYYKRLGLTCGTRWTLFRRTVEKYRAWLDQQYGGSKRLRQSLIFAHNDVSHPARSRSYHLLLNVELRRNTGTFCALSHRANHLYCCRRMSINS